MKNERKIFLDVVKQDICLSYYDMKVKLYYYNIIRRRLGKEPLNKKDILTIWRSIHDEYKPFDEALYYLALDIVFEYLELRNLIDKYIDTLSWEHFEG